MNMKCGLKYFTYPLFPDKQQYILSSLSASVFIIATVGLLLVAQRLKSWFAEYSDELDDNREHQIWNILCLIQYMNSYLYY
jgi:hypothetical protein